jgi:YEATS domain-containing protein 1/3
MATKAPHEVKEFGYAGFLIPIKINFKNGIYVERTYDLCLLKERDLDSMRNEKLTFNNPTDKFRKQLFAGGGYPVKKSPRRCPPLLSDIKKDKSEVIDKDRERKRKKEDRTKSRRSESDHPSKKIPVAEKEIKKPIVKESIMPPAALPRAKEPRPDVEMKTSKKDFWLEK